MSTIPWPGRITTHEPNIFSAVTCERCGARGSEVRCYTLTLFAGTFSMAKTACEGCKDAAASYILAMRDWRKGKEAEMEEALRKARAEVEARFAATMPKF